MRRLLPALVITVWLAVFASVSHAGVITLAWDSDPSWETDGVTGVIIYAAPADTITWQRVAKVPYPATTVRLRMPDIEGGYDYKATAYTLRPWQESGYSNTVTGTPDAAKTDRAAVLVPQ
jgi:hypothetical protein